MNSWLGNDPYRPLRLWLKFGSHWISFDRWIGILKLTEVSEQLEVSAVISVVLMLRNALFGVFRVW